MPAPNLVTLASLHAALDSILDIEALFSQIHLPVRAATVEKRLNALASEMRKLLVDLLRTEPR